jgi:hypothetical protein
VQADAEYASGSGSCCCRKQFVFLPSINIRHHLTRAGFIERCSYGSNGQDCSLRGRSALVPAVMCSSLYRRLRRQLFLYRPLYKLVNFFFHTLQFLWWTNSTRVKFRINFISSCWLQRWGFVSMYPGVPRDRSSQHRFSSWFSSCLHANAKKGFQVSSCYAKLYTQTLPIQFRGI